MGKKCVVFTHIMTADKTMIKELFIPYAVDALIEIAKKSKNEALVELLERGKRRGLSFDDYIKQHVEDFQKIGLDISEVEEDDAGDSWYNNENIIGETSAWDYIADAFLVRETERLLVEVDPNREIPERYSLYLNHIADTLLCISIEYDLLKYYISLLPFFDDEYDDIKDLFPKDLGESGGKKILDLYRAWQSLYLFLYDEGMRGDTNILELKLSDHEVREGITGINDEDLTDKLRKIQYFYGLIRSADFDYYDNNERKIILDIINNTFEQIYKRVVQKFSYRLKKKMVYSILDDETEREYEYIYEVACVEDKSEEVISQMITSQNDYSFMALGKVSAKIKELQDGIANAQVDNDNINAGILNEIKNTIENISKENASGRINIEGIGKYKKEQGCYAVITQKETSQKYMALSGVEELYNRTKIEKLVQAIKGTIIGNGYEWAELDGNTIRYTDEEAVKKNGYFPPETLLNDYPSLPGDKDKSNVGKVFGCCERKIVPNIQKGNTLSVYSRWAPCWKCQPISDDYKMQMCVFFATDFQAWKKEGCKSDVHIYDIKKGAVYKTERKDI